MRTARNSILFLVIVSGIVAFNDVLDAQPVEGDPELESYLREVIENFREQMKAGIDAIKMPVLDPLVLKHLDIKVREQAAELDLKIHEMSIEGLANFTVPFLQANLEELYVNLTLGIQLLIVQGQYNLSCMIYKIIPIYGNGPFSLTVMDAIVSGTGQLLFIEKDLMQMTSLGLDLEWYNMTMQLGNFLGGGSLQKVLERAIPGVGKELFLGFKHKILQHLNEFVMKKINEELSDPKVRKIVSGILQNE